MKKALIIGFGSIGRKHFNVLKSLKKFKSIAVFTRLNIKNVEILKSKKEIKAYKPDYIVIASSTNEHLEHINFFEKSFKKKTIVVEKPSLGFYKKMSLKNNKYFVGYNLRVHPIINFIKDKLKKYDFWEISIECNSYLPNWRKNIHYSKSSSAQKKNYGGVIRDLSHEIDYLYYFIGDFKIKSFLKKKISNLKINTEDYFNLIGICKKKKIINLKLSYLSKFHKREIVILGPKLQLKASLTDDYVHYFIKKKFYKKKFNYSIDKTYKDMHRNILNNNVSKISTFENSLKVLKFIDKVQGK